ncbi:MAG: GntR family transcriptional regulator [Gemmatimonadetes bacterium]|jgi:DNA-binding GntR family transcriptional regulator|nr:GntR family transcriptional regulator [Gemmatimonadota bacterium]MBT6149806.1 GntR family transcriptional regulator [Gemmatimonadota bacterium]MBT7862424.1 GntR family transcriptional regulator [Gemmatimonadota bacterium]
MGSSSSDQRLSTVLDLDQKDATIDRTLLSERVAATLRGYISDGRIPEGTKITEREVSALLGVSRAPARDALKLLELEGLVIVRPGGRYVTTLTEADVRDLHDIRCALETLAIRLAAERIEEQGRVAIEDSMQQLRVAATSADPSDWTRYDLALHRSIWQASGNQHLLNVLSSVLGPVFVLADRDKAQRLRDIAEDLQHHQDLVDLIVASKPDEAASEMKCHLDRSLQFTLETFQLGEPV